MTVARAASGLATQPGEIAEERIAAGSLRIASNAVESELRRCGQLNVSTAVRYVTVTFELSDRRVRFGNRTPFQKFLSCAAGA
jgi:hypothetical protein